MSRILIAEDEPHIVRFLGKGLPGRGAHHGQHPGRQGGTSPGPVRPVRPDAARPGAARHGRAGGARRATARPGTLPVIVLTARNAADDMVAGLDGGADDYMSKPFRLAELLARVRLRLRPAAAPGDLRAAQR